MSKIDIRLSTFTYTQSYTIFANGLYFTRALVNLISVKATLLRRGSTPDQSFMMSRHDFQHFLKLWHYHEELELVFIEKSEGTRFIGDSIDRFETNDLLLIGSNLPHMFQNDKAFFEPDSTARAVAQVIHFHPQFLNTQLGQIPEFIPLDQLLKDAALGIRFSKKATEAVNDEIAKINELSGAASLICFLNILNILSQDDYTTIASPGFVSQFEGVSDERLGQVYDYVMNHFQEKISIEEIADLVSMNKASFCRYFKRITQKTFTDFLNDIRIGFACKMLLENHMSILEVCYHCGYNNVSHFNRQFRKKMKLSPSAYQRSRVKSV